MTMINEELSFPSAAPKLPGFRIQDISTGMFLHFNCESWVKTELYAWYGTEAQFNTLICWTDMDTTNWELVPRTEN